MPQANLESIVQRMIDAGEPEEAIKSVIQEMSKRNLEGITTGPNPDLTGVTTGPQQPRPGGPGSPLDIANKTPPSEPTSWDEGFRGSLNQLLTKEGINNTLKGFTSGVGQGAVNLAKAAVDPRTYVQSGGPEHQRMLDEATGTLAPSTDYGLADATQHFGTPEQVGELTGNVMMGAVAPSILSGARRGAPSVLGGAARVAEAGGRVSPTVTATAGGWVGGGPGASIGAAIPATSRALGRGLRGGQRILSGRSTPPDMPFPSTMPGGPQSGTRPAPPYRPRPDVPDSPAATGTAEWYPERPTPEPILNPPDSPNARGAAEWYPERPAPEPTVTPDSPNASGRLEWYPERNVAPEPGPTGTAEWYPERPAPPPGPVPTDAPILRKPPKTPDQILDEMLQDGLTPETPTRVSAAPEPTLTKTGRPSVTAAEQAAIEKSAAGRGTPRVEEITPDAELDIGTTSGYEPTKVRGGGASTAAAPAGEAPILDTLVEDARNARQQQTINDILDYHGRNNMPGVSRKQAAQVDTRPFPHALSGEAQARIAGKVSEGLASPEARQSLIEYYNNARNDLFKNQLGTAMRKAGILPSE